jgi:hypothetical protein
MAQSCLVTSFHYVCPLKYCSSPLFHSQAHLVCVQVPCFTYRPTLFVFKCCVDAVHWPAEGICHSQLDRSVIICMFSRCSVVSRPRAVRGAKLTNHFHLTTRLRICGGMPPLHSLSHISSVPHVWTLRKPVLVPLCPSQIPHGLP